MMTVNEILAELEKKQQELQHAIGLFNGTRHQHALNTQAKLSAKEVKVRCAIAALIAPSL